jgi:hypothetical protein
LPVEAEKAGQCLVLRLCYSHGKLLLSLGHGIHQVKRHQSIAT